jgi:YVTN family beta-propeller protein
LNGDFRKRAGRNSIHRGILMTAFFCLVLIAGCQGMQTRVKPVLEEEGDVLLYLQPFPQEADRLRFTVEGITARRSDGREFPFSLSISELDGRALTRQRLLAAAQLPQGSYTGLSVKVKDALLRGEEGEAALLVPDTPVGLEFPFTVARKKGYLIALAFKPQASVTGGFSFMPVFSLSIPPPPIPGLTGYVSNQGANNITVFDKKSGEAVRVIPTGGGPAGIALDQRARRAYAAIPNSDTIETIDVTAGEVTDRIMLRSGDRPSEVALSPDGRTLFTANAGSNTVSAIDLFSFTESGRITVGNGPASILVDRPGRRAYIFNGLSSTISVIDVANRALAATITTEPGPLRGQFNRNGDRLYVIHEWSPYLSVIDTASLAVVKRISVGMGFKAMKVDTSTDMLYLGKDHDVTVGVYEPFSLFPVDFLQTGSGITFLTIDGEGNNLLMVSPEGRRLLIMNLISRKTLSVIEVGDAPYGVTVMGER